MGIAATAPRPGVGCIPPEGGRAKREEINARLRTKLDEVATRWGVKVTNVEIREILPPKNVTDAMILQMSAERSRRPGAPFPEAGENATRTPAPRDGQPARPPSGGPAHSAPLARAGYASYPT